MEGIEYFPIINPANDFIGGINYSYAIHCTIALRIQAFCLQAHFVWKYQSSEDYADSYSFLLEEAEEC
jgi:hypothetical protein